MLVREHKQVSLSIYKDRMDRYIIDQGVGFNKYPNDIPKLISYLNSFPESMSTEDVLTSIESEIILGSNLGIRSDKHSGHWPQYTTYFIPVPHKMILFVADTDDNSNYYFKGECKDTSITYNGEFTNTLGPVVSGEQLFPEDEWIKRLTSPRRKNMSQRRTDQEELASPYGEVGTVFMCSPRSTVLLQGTHWPQIRSDGSSRSVFPGLTAKKRTLIMGIEILVKEAGRS